MASNKTRLDYLADATAQQLVEELVRRRLDALKDCSDTEIEAELAARTGVDRLPKLVEK